MKAFELYNPVRLVFGENKIETLNQYLPSKAKIMLVYGGGSIKKNGIYDIVVKALEHHQWIEFSGVEPNPHYETLMQAVDLVKKEHIDFILAVGGGSVIDGSKFIAAASCYPKEPWHILETYAAEVTQAIPLGAVLTLPATGSEMNGGAVITKKSTLEKRSFRSVYTFPQFSILDSRIVDSLPKRQIANGVVDAFVHIMEQYMIYNEESTPIQDGFSETLLKTLIFDGTKAYQDCSDLVSVQNFMFSATMALNGLIGVGVVQDWSTHLIGHELTAFFGIDHARTLAIVLPGLWKASFEQKKDKLAQYGRNVWGLSGKDEEVAKQAIEKTEQFFNSLDVPTRLSDYIKLEQYETLGKIPQRFKERNWKVSETGKVDYQVVADILKDRW